MKHVCVLSLVALTLVSCASGPETRPVSKALAPAPKPTYAVGDRFIWQTKDGEVTDEIVSIRGDSLRWRSSTGSTWMTPIDFSMPAESWMDTSDDGFGRGEQEATEIRGAMFPLKVGNQTSMRVQGKSDTWPDGWDHQRNCEANDQENIDVPAGSFDTFKIICASGNRTRTYNYSPEVGHIVYYNNHHKDKGSEKRVLIRHEKAKDHSVHP